MIANSIDRRTVRSALELAVRAPSVHNSQPWRWQLGTAACTSTPTASGGCR